MRPSHWKQWRIFKAQDVKRKRKASLARYLRGAILMYGEAKRNLEFIGGERDRQLQQLWAETKIGDILPWEDVEREAERLLESTRANARNSENSLASQEQDDDRTVDRDETDPYNEVIFGRRRPDLVAIEWTSKTVYVLEFKRTSDQRQDYRELGECLGAGSNTA